MIRCVWLGLTLLALQACSGSQHDEDLTAALLGTCSPGAHTTADPTGAEAYRTAYYGALCDRAFTDCGVELGTGGYSSASECRAAFASLCSYGYFSHDYYDAPCGNACLDFIAHSPCSAFESSPPQACDEATGTFPPACATISAGTISDTIVVGDPLLYGGHSRRYCLALTAGHSLTLETSAPLSGTEIVDTQLILLALDGTDLAYNDDYTGSYSRIYVASLPATGTYEVIVAGYYPFDVGSYQLTVTAP